MVLDSLKNIEFYTSLNPLFEKAFKYIRETDIAAMEPGKYEIEGKEIFININESNLKTPETAALEVHDAYIDIQILIRGKEGFGWKDRETCTQPRGEMNTEKDILFYDDKPSTYYTMEEGEFCILFPQDAHAPCVGNGTGSIRKAILKIKA